MKITVYKIDGVTILATDKDITGDQAHYILQTLKQARESKDNKYAIITASEIVFDESYLRELEVNG